MRKVIQKIEYKDKLIELYDWMEYKSDEPARNVECYDLDGKLLWTISSLTKEERTDCWTNINVKDDKLKASNFMGYSCEIDMNDGTIINQVFTK
ncbi:hypothetical protein [Croceitalea vernalis]|uniref:Uncharacterized protein n=1 Tax=Croceitalea vernalis TaxID=3075599 RepID=A0ABU3BIU3_9FLAO|nr:hypothetical protein [Croceitalea sp. P007]MDT0622030.1 hypothetical protein [Croceitalea sp. P007]